MQIPAKRYNGAPIGTSYDIRIHMGTTLDIPSNSVENQLTLQNTAEQDEERLQRRSMVRLGVRVIHKVPAEAKLYQIPNSSNSTILPRTLRLRLSPKALKLANKFTTTASTAANSVEENEPQVNQDNLGSMSRIDVGGSFQRFGESRVSSWFFVIENFACVFWIYLLCGENILLNLNSEFFLLGK